MANLIIKGGTHSEPRLKAASVAITAGALMAADGSGNVTNATSTSNFLVGLSTRNVVSTQSDYASNTEISVIMPDDRTIFTMSVGVSGPLTQANVGLAYDLTDANTVNLGATAKKVVTCVGLTGDTTVGQFKINSRESDANHV